MKKDNTCRFCFFNKGIKKKKVDCEYDMKIKEIPEWCADKRLTKEGWLNASVEAANAGNAEASIYYRIIADKI